MFNKWPKHNATDLNERAFEGRFSIDVPNERWTDGEQQG
jgi:hypothetical protein